MNFEEIDLNDNKSEATVMMVVRTGKEVAGNGVTLISIGTISGILGMALMLVCIKKERRYS